MNFTEVSINSQPLLRDLLCRKICRIDQDHNDPIQFQDKLVFANGLTLELLLQSRGSEESCSLIARATTSRVQCQPINLELHVLVRGSCNQQQNPLDFKNVSEARKRFLINESCSQSPQTITLSDVVRHRTITHEITDAFLFFIITGRILQRYTSEISSDGFVNIDFAP